MTKQNKIELFQIPIEKNVNLFKNKTVALNDLICNKKKPSLKTEKKILLQNSQV